MGTVDCRPVARYWLQKYRFPVARVRARVEKLPLFGEPRTRRRFSKQYYAARQKSLLDAGIIRRGRWASVVLALPEADGAFVLLRALSRGLVASCRQESAPRAIADQ
jgi:hypothetical protein